MAKVILALILLMTNFAALADTSDFDSGVAAYHQDNYAAALGPLNDAIKADPLWAEAHQYLGRALLKLGRWVEAVERLSRAYDLMPEARQRLFWAELWASILQALAGLLDTGQFDEALVVAHDAWTMASEQPTARDDLMALLLTSSAQLLRDGRLQEWLDGLGETQQATPQLTQI